MNDKIPRPSNDTIPPPTPPRTPPPSSGPPKPSVEKAAGGLVDNIKEMAEDKIKETVKDQAKEAVSGFFGSSSSSSSDEAGGEGDDVSGDAGGDASGDAGDDAGGESPDYGGMMSDLNKLRKRGISGTLANMTTIPDLTPEQAEAIATANRQREETKSKAEVQSLVKGAAMSLLTGQAPELPGGGGGRLKKIEYIASYGDNEFYTSMCGAPGASCPESCGWCFCGTVCCLTQAVLRKKLLDGDMSRYKLFQGNAQMPGINVPYPVRLDRLGKPNCLSKVKPLVQCLGGEKEEQACPQFFMVMESLLCWIPSVTANRQMVMKRYLLKADPWDNRVIWCNNGFVDCITKCKKYDVTWGCCQCCGAGFNGWEVMGNFATCLYFVIMGMTTAQLSNEYDYRNGKGKFAPPTVVPEPALVDPMDRGEDPILDVAAGAGVAGAGIGVAGTLADSPIPGGVPSTAILPYGVEVYLNPLSYVPSDPMAYVPSVKTLVDPLGMGYADAWWDVTRPEDTAADKEADPPPAWMVAIGWA